MKLDSVVACACGQEFKSQVAWRRHMRHCEKVETIDLTKALLASLKSESLTPPENRECQVCGRQVPLADFDAHTAAHRITPTDLIALHEAVIDATIGQAGPLTILRHLAMVVALHLKTQDRAEVQGAITRLMERGLVQKQDASDLWNPRGLWEVNPF